MKYIKSCILIFVFLLVGIVVRADDLQDSTIVKVEAWDESRVDYRCPTEEAIEVYKADPDYRYDGEKQEESLLRRFFRWLSSLIHLDQTGFDVFLWVLILLAVAVLMAIILHLSGMPIKGLLMYSRSAKVTQLSFNLDNTDINNQQLPRLLEQYIRNEAYREATRIMFLLVLKRLDEKDMIQWQKWKTDREYYYELKQTQLKPAFKEVMRGYEYIWFGQFPIDKTEFGHLKGNCDAFINRIK